MVYIEGRRNNLRLHSQTEVMVFSNASSVTLVLNGRPVGTLTPDEYHICRFPVSLDKGVNVIKALAGNLEDSCEWTLQ